MISISLFRLFYTRLFEEFQIDIGIDIFLSRIYG